MRFGLFIKQEWFFTNPNYTWSVYGGLTVEGKIWWHQWDPTQLRTHRHVYNLPFQCCSRCCCHCTNLEKLCYRFQARASHQTEGVAPVEPTVAVGTSQCGQVCTMSQRMALPMSQQDFFGGKGMHYIASQSTMSKTIEDLFHDSQL